MAIIEPTDKREKGFVDRDGDASYTARLPLGRDGLPSMTVGLEFYRGI